jgi:L-glyceraldehyde 3-phosphate reductase
VAYEADPARYEQIPYRRCGRSGIELPAITLGLWQNFGAATPFATVRAMLTRAFDRGVNHFDLANNYGPPPGYAEEALGHALASDLRRYRDELFISTKAGYDMWPGPYGMGGGSRKYLLASLDQSLQRMGLEYVDLFYSHRFDPDTPLEETMGALASAIAQGKALYAGISSYSPAKTREAAAILRDMGVPLLIHQPSYSILNRWIETELLDVLDDGGIGCIAFSPLAQGMLTDKYLDGVPAGSRAAVSGSSLQQEWLSEENIEQIRVLNDIAKDRGQSLAQMAIAWALRDRRVTSALIGARNVAQLDENLDALHRLEFSADELAAIDRSVNDAGIDLWAPSREAG